MSLGTHLVNTASTPVTIFGVKFNPGVPTFISMNLLQNSQTVYYMGKGILKKCAPTRVTEASKKPAAKPAPKKAEVVKVETVDEVEDSPVEVKVVPVEAEPKPKPARRRRRRTKKSETPKES